MRFRSLLATEEIDTLTSIVLAGGKSLRLGRDKAFEVIGDDSLIQRVILRLTSLSDQIIVVVAGEDEIPRLRHLGTNVVADIYPGKSSLGGIYTGLMTSDSPHNLVVACDMPFLNPALLGYMIKLSSPFDLVIPRVGGRIEPLHAIYSKDCLASIEWLFGQDRLINSELCNLVRVRYVEEDEIDRFDPDHLSFFNINTSADLKLARTIASVKQASRRNG